MEEKNYYEILEVSPNASLEIIKIAYKSLVKKYHPDNNENVNIEKIRKVNEAYQILSNPEKRKKYDEDMNIEKNTETQFTDSIIGFQEKIHAVLEKVSRMFVNIVDNDNIYFSSRLDINKTLFYQKCKRYVYFPADVKVFILYGYRYSGSDREMDEVMAITETGLFIRDKNAEDAKHIGWLEFVGNDLRIESNRIWIGNYCFSSCSSDDLFAILKETHRLFNNENVFEGEDEERESIIYMKLKHNGAYIIGSILWPAFFYMMGWDNWLVKIIDASVIWWLCSFINEVIGLLEFEEQMKKIAKWFIYGAGVFIWYVLTR